MTQDSTYPETTEQNCSVAGTGQIGATKFEPTAEMVRAAETLFLAMAHESLIRPIVTSYKTAILAKNGWRIRPAFTKRFGDEIIVDPKDAYLMDESEFASYHLQCKAARDAAQLPVDHPDQCPLFVAEDVVRQAKHALIECMYPVTKMSAHRLLCAGMNDYEKYVGLALRLLAPFGRKASDILKDIRTQ